MIAEQIASSLGAIETVTKETKRLNAEHEKASKRAQACFDETQWVFGKTAMPLKAVLCSTEKHRSIEEYRSAKTTTEVSTVSKANQWVMLCYPMERVELDTGYQYLMRCKQVNPKTGQMNVCWAVVFEEIEEKSHRAIAEFSMVPH